MTALAAWDEPGSTSTEAFVHATQWGWTVGWGTVVGIVAASFGGVALAAQPSSAPTGPPVGAAWTGFPQPPTSSALRQARTQYRGLSVGGAWRTAERHFPDAASERAFSPLGLQAGQEAEYLSDYVARIEQKGVAPRWAQSSMPIRHKGRPVDVELLEADGELAARNPLVETRVARRVSRGVLLKGSGVRVRPMGLADGDAHLTNGRAFHASVERDLDQIVLGQPLGAEFLWQIRSPQAPESVRLAVDAPGNTSLRLRAASDISTDSLASVSDKAPARVEVVRNGRVIASIDPPTTVDSAGAVVRTWYELDGDTVVVRFPHRDQTELLYPLLVDPAVVEAWSGADWGPDGWFSESFPFGGASLTFARNCCGIAGLQVGALRFGNYANNATGQWSWFTHPGSYIAAATFGYQHNPDQTVVFSGIHRDGVGWEQLNNDTRSGSTLTASHNNPNGADGTRAVFGMRTSPGGVRQVGALAALRSAIFYLGDRHPPTVTVVDHSPANPSAWTDAPVQYVKLTAHDTGLGLKSIGVTRTDRGDPNTGTVQSGYWAGGPVESDCTGTRRFRCENDATTEDGRPVFVNGRMPYYLAPNPNGGQPGLEEGTHQIRASAAEVLGGTYGNNVYSPTWTVKIDRTPPTITPSGTLWDARGGWVNADDDLTLQVNATDGATSPATAQRSGVTSLTAKLDGQPMDGGELSQTCTAPEGSCSLTANITLTAAQLEELTPGEHTIDMHAVDALGHPTPVGPPNQFKFKVDTVAPEINLSGSLSERGAIDGQKLTEGAYRLVANARDNVPSADEVADDGSGPPSTADPASGLRDLVIRLDGQTVPTTAVSCTSDPNCEDARLWDWNSTGVSNGPHTVSVTAADNADNQYEERWSVDVQHVPDEPTRTNVVRRTILGGSVGGRLGTSVAALGDVNGDGYADYGVGASGVSAFGRTSPGTAYLLLGSSSSSTIDLSAPGAEVRFYLGAGNNRFCGTSVAAAGDVNGDGLNDMLIGCPGLDSTLGSLSPTSGKVYVVFGRTDPQNLDLANIGAAGFESAGFAVAGPTETAGLDVPLVAVRPAVFGERLQSARLTGDHSDQYLNDVNGDGLADIAIGDSASNTTYVIYGKANGATVAAASLGAAGFTIHGAGNTLSGYSATVAGDVDGDTLADVVVGAPGSPNRLAPGVGSASVVFGVDTTEVARGNVDLTNPGDRAVTLTGGATGDRFGATVAGLGDTNLDSREDLAVGTSEGAYVIRALPASSRQISVDDGYRVTGAANVPIAGVAAAPVAPAGDIDGDERADLVLGYPDAPGARAYTVLSPERSRTIDVRALPGQRGSTNNVGTQGERSGAAVGGNTFQGRTPVTENAQAILGAPGASPNLRIGAGAAYVMQERVPTGPGAEPEDTGPSSASAGAPAAVTKVGFGPGLWVERSQWASVRNKWFQFIIGSIKQGEVMDAFTVDPNNNHEWLWGHIRNSWATRKSTDCGWIYRLNADGPSPSDTERVPCQIKLIPPDVFSSIFNCDFCEDGSTVNLRYNPKLYGPAPPRIPVYKNVQPGRREHGHDVAGYINYSEGSSVPVQVKWRYVTLHHKFVLVRWARPISELPQNPDGSRAFTTGYKWGYIDRDWFPGLRRLCGYNSPTKATGKDPDGENDRPGRDRWPRVCKQDGIFNVDETRP